MRAAAGTPRVSVIVTTYNQAPYIGSAIRSVLAQTFKEFELIVVDDGSTDATAEVMRQFQHDARYIRQPNAGVAASRNTGVAAARGELIAFLDGDDVWEPEKLAVQVAAAGRWPRSVVIAVDGVEFNDGQVLRASLFGSSVRAQLTAPGEELSVECTRELIAANLITTVSQVMIPKAALDRVGASDVALKIASDYDLYLRLARHGPFTFINAPLTRWRYVETSASGPRDRRTVRWSSSEIAVLKKMHGRCPSALRRDVVVALRQRLRDAAEATYQYGVRGNRAWAVRHLTWLWTQAPLNTEIPIYLLALATPRRVVTRLTRLVRS